MIQSLHINNYKSIFDLTLKVGRFNVFIGENGCGKSNILEAIALAGAASVNKLDNEFLVPRGIRNTKPELMRSSFDNESSDKEIEISVKFKDSEIEEKYTLINDNKDYSKWTRQEGNISEMLNILNRLQNKNLITKLVNSDALSYLEEIIAFDMNKEKLDEYSITVYTKHCNNVKSNEHKLEQFIIYSPENTALRNFEREGQIEPLGINGEGLLKLLKVIQNKSPEQFEEIDETLQLFDWYDNFELHKDSDENKITIKDRYLTQSFDQRSANEGFLFVLFYIALMVSDDTPKIFAIDNIDVALNPKLCTKLIKELIRLAKKYDKQVFVTTHNPAILDGINLGDEEQRLLVVSRDDDTGHTCCEHIALKDKPKSSLKTRLSKVFKDDDVFKEKSFLSKEEILNRLDNSPEPLKLSEAFLRGYLGGLPEGF